MDSVMTLFKTSLNYYPHNKSLMKGNISALDAAPILDHQFERISTMAFDGQERLWIADSFHSNGSLFRIDTAGNMIEYARNLTPENPSDPVVTSKNHQLLYGVSFDEEGNPITTHSASREVIKINTDLAKEVIYQSPKYYFPVGNCMIGSKLVIMEVGFIPGEGHKGPRLVEMKNNKKDVIYYFNVRNVVYKKIIQVN